MRQIFKYDLINSITDHLDEALQPGYSLSDYQLTEVTLKARGKASQASRSVTSGDIIRLQKLQQDHQQLQQNEMAEIIAREAMLKKNQLRSISGKPKSVIIIDPPGHGRIGDHYFHVCCPSVRPSVRHENKNDTFVKIMSTYWL